MQPTVPFWFNQRQAKAEPAGDNTMRVTAPNQQEAFLLVRQNGDRWGAALRLAAGGPDMATADGYETPADAWNVAFEMYRVKLVV